MVLFRRRGARGGTVAACEEVASINSKSPLPIFKFAFAVLLIATLAVLTDDVKAEMASPPAVQVNPSGSLRGDAAPPAKASRRGRQGQPRAINPSTCVTEAGACWTRAAPGSPCQCTDESEATYSGVAE